MLNIVHVTHEAVSKIGGIGAVLEGLITAADYVKSVDRTILLAPLFSTAGDVDSRLGPQGEVLYSSLDGRCDHPLAGAFREIEQHYSVGIVYGHRLLREPLSGRQQRAEVLLIDVQQAAVQHVNAFKAHLFTSFDIDSSRYEESWGYEMYTRLAEPGLAAVRALTGQASGGDCVIIAHEYMGMPTALSAKLHPEWGMNTAYYTHEVCSARKVVEEHSGHDTMFYSVLEKASSEGLIFEDLFGDQSGYYRHVLTEAGRHLDIILAVGDNVVAELKFLSPSMAQHDIRLVYNGVPVCNIDPDEAATSKRRMMNYAQTLLGDSPDYILTHVTRMSISKGLWRDLNVMRAVERQLRNTKETAVLFVLSTELGGPRPIKDILHMERWWDWPVSHREGPPDLSDGEALFYQGVQSFNARSRNCKIVFINQFGFDRHSCGDRIPAEMEWADIRRGSDVEFGQSIYEPFGIAQIESLCFGTICVISSVCGCCHFARRTAGRGGVPNLIVADYCQYKAEPDSIEGYQNLERSVREAFEMQVADQIASELVKRLPRSAQQKADYIKSGQEYARQMSWDVIARDYFLPAIREITSADKLVGAK